MSIYSGFATKKQEKDYNKCIDALIVVLFKRISKVYTKESCDEDQFKSYLVRILSCMFELEASKYQNPKYSKRSELLCNLLNIDYKSPLNTLNQIKEENIKQKNEYLQSNNSKVKRHNFRILSNKQSSSKTFNTLDDNSSCQTTIINGDEDARNTNSYLGGTSRSGNTSFSHYQNNSILQVNSMRNRNIRGQSRGESVNEQYKEGQGHIIRPKSSFSCSETVNLCSKISSNNSLNIQPTQQQVIKKKKYQDYLEKYEENYFTDQLDKNDDCLKKFSKEDDLMQTTKNQIEMEYSDDSNEGLYHIQDEEQIVKNIDNIKKEQDSQQIPIEFIIEQEERSQSLQQSHQSRKLNPTTQLQQSSNQLFPIKSYLSQSQQSQYSTQSQQLQQSQQLNNSKQLKQSQQLEQQQISSQSNQSHIIQEQQEQQQYQHSQRSSQPQSNYKPQLSSEIQQSQNLSNFQEQENLQNETESQEITQKDQKMITNHLKSNSDFVQSNEVNQQGIIAKKQKLSQENKQKPLIQKINKQRSLTQSQSYGNSSFKHINQSFDIQNNSCAFSKEKTYTTLTKEQNDEMTQDTADFKELNFLNSSTSNLQIKESKFDQNNNPLKSQKTASLTIKQPRFSISVDGEDEKKQNSTRNETEVSENTYNLNIQNPRKKSSVDTIEVQMKDKSPQFYESQINSIKQQLSMQSTYLQIQQKQLDEKLREQQQQLQKELQESQINQQLIMNRETNSIKNVIMQQDKSQSQLQNQNNSHQQLIKEVQEEEEEESIYKERKKRMNKIEQIQRRQLNKENQIQQSSEESIQKVFIAEEIDLKLNDVQVNQNNIINNQQTQLQAVLQIHQNKLINKNYNTKRIKNDENNQNNCQDKFEMEVPLNENYIFQQQQTHSNTNQLQQQYQVKKRIKVLQQNSKQRALKDISNQINVKENIKKDCNQQLDSQLKINNSTLDKETIEEQDNYDRSSNISPTLLSYNKQNNGFNKKKSSLEPIVPKIGQQNRIQTDILINNLKNNYPLSSSSKRSKTQENTIQSPSQNKNFQQSPKQKILTNESIQIQKGQYKISKKRDVSQTIREQFADTTIKEISTDIYINNSNINSKKNDQLTPFWAEENNQKLKQSFSKERIQEKNNNINYSFYNQAQNSENIQMPIPQVDQNIILSKIINCPINPQYLNKLQMQPKSRNETISPKYHARSQSSTSSSNQQYHTYQANENINTPFLIQTQSKIQSQAHSPISSASNQKNQAKEKISVRDSFFKF